MSRANQGPRSGYIQGPICPVPILRQISIILRSFASRQTPWPPRAMRLPQCQSAFLEQAESTKFAPSRNGDVRCPRTTVAVAHVGSVTQVRFCSCVAISSRSREALQYELARIALSRGDDGALVVHARISHRRGISALSVGGYRIRPWVRKKQKNNSARVQVFRIAWGVLSTDFAYLVASPLA